MPPSIPRRPLGQTGLTVPILGLGTGGLGGHELSEDQVGTVLNRAVDFGLALIDAAPSYGHAEARIGRHLSWRRDDYVLMTKVGYGVTGVPDWTAGSIIGGVEMALRRLRTDHLDIALLHSCPLPVLVREELGRALEAVVQAGKVRVAGYSGENEALDHALTQPWCRVVEVSVNPFDQHSLDHGIPAAVAKGIGVIAKRTLANTPWRFETRPVGHYAETYWERRAAMGLAVPIAPEAHALRFAAYAPGVSAALVGTSKTQHVESCAAWVAEGPLPADLWDATRAAFKDHDQGWRGQI